MEMGAISLLPPVIAIMLAIATRKVVIPLATGVLIGSLLLSVDDQADFSYYDLGPYVVTASGDDAGSWPSFLTLSQEKRQASVIVTSWWHSPLVFLKSIKEAVFSTSHLQALVFSLLLGAMVGVLEGAGAALDLVRRISSRIRSRTGAQTVIATSGLAVFFDDYANTLLLGGTMRSTADRYGISREKLAYLVDSTAAPVASIALVSTWAAIEISYIADGLRDAGIQESGAAFRMFIQSIPYRFYPCLALVMVFMVAVTGRDFGPMRLAENSSSEGSRRDDGKTQQNSDELKHHERPLFWAAVVPVITCLVTVCGVLVITGLGSIEKQEFDSSLRRFGEILGNGDSYLGLMAGGAAGLLVALVMQLWLGEFGIKASLGFAWKGAKQMMPAVVILWFAWALSGLTEMEKLDTAGYLTQLLSENISIGLLPTLVFLLSGAIAFSTGTSWGTMGILTPLSVALAIELDPIGGPGGAITMATCGSVLAGAIFGDHCSPISDTTVLSSRASGCDHMAHVRTQMPYAIVVGLVCVFCGTLPASWGLSPWLSLMVGAIVLIVLLRWLGRTPDRETEARTGGSVTSD